MGSIEQQENFLIICGQRDTRKEGYNFSSKFSQSFYLDPTIKFDKINAALDNGVLTISAPKELTKVEKKIRKLPITVVNSGNAVKKEEKEEKKSEGEKKKLTKQVMKLKVKQST